MATLKFAYFLIKGMFCSKYSRILFHWRYIFIVWPLEYLIKKLLVPTKQATVSFRSNHAMHCYICYVISGLKHMSLNFGWLSFGHFIFASARMWGSVVIFRNQKGSSTEIFSKTLPWIIVTYRLWPKCCVASCDRFGSIRLFGSFYQEALWKRLFRMYIYQMVLRFTEPSEWKCVL